MELRHLRYFAALAEELSFTRAAAKVHVTQSTLSHQIKQLEAELGQPLFSRIGKRVVITEAGEMLLAGVTRGLREIDDGVRSLKATPGQPQEPLGSARPTRSMSSSSRHALRLFFGVTPGSVLRFLNCRSMRSRSNWIGKP